MITDALLEQLRYKGEGADLDYKAERYPFAKATDEAKSELLKDILALANAVRDGTAYILIGFKENPPHPADVVGLPSEGIIDDSRLQEFVNEKLDTKLNFRYEERVFDGKHIAVISIPKQQRPFYLKKNYGNVLRDTVYVRRGSSTGIASPREIAMMGAANQGEAHVELLLQTPENQPLPDAFRREFLNFPTNLPDYKSGGNGYFSPPILSVNRNFWRDGANHLSSWKRGIQVRVSLFNRSNFPLGDMHLEMKCLCPVGESVSLLRADNMPEKPSTSGLFVAGGLASLLEQTRQRMIVNDRGNEPVVHIALGKR
ncbi:AlbA family DNA-binding domain-containing protein [Ralstonia pseudosolanacearum]|uniref:AlbA family DNA-binding domain-containing protein n=1 Tax=Ralstonia pseudosolanacearum TaxID=1310165 RepID=UPI004053E075